MKWITDYQLFLFDFDGLLVNTEEIHYQAYQLMCEARGFELPWNFSQYCLIAHYDATKLRKTLYVDIPQLYVTEPNWDVLYAEKKKFVLDLLSSGAVHLMPGVYRLLSNLQDKQIPSCVVTNSPEEQVSIIKKYNPILNSISYWFTRETYSQPKPSPDGYLNAIKQAGQGISNIIGFEDTPRGLEALLNTPAKPVFVSKVDYPETPEFIQKGVLHFSSLSDLPDNQLS